MQHWLYVNLKNKYLLLLFLTNWLWILPSARKVQKIFVSAVWPSWSASSVNVLKENEKFGSITQLIAVRQMPALISSSCSTPTIKVVCERVSIAWHYQSIAGLHFYKLSFMNILNVNMTVLSSVDAPCWLPVKSFLTCAYVKFGYCCFWVQQINPDKP